MSAESSVLELRQYTLHPDRRDELIALFEREFVESQEALGIRVLGMFRDLDNPDRFVWIRGFADMAARAAALPAFYGGPIWKQHREAANATMIDNDNVLLLEPLCSDESLRAALSPRPPIGAESRDDGTLAITICSLHADTNRDVVRAIDGDVHARHPDVIACLATKHAVNNFPALPVREGESVIAWLHHGDEPVLLDRARWNDHVVGATELRLQPTPRSTLQVISSRA